MQGAHMCTSCSGTAAPGGWPSQRCQKWKEQTDTDGVSVEAKSSCIALIFFFFCLCSYVAQMIRRREIILYVKGAVLKSVRYFLARKCFICFLRVSFDLLSLPPILDNCTVSNRIDRSFKIKSNVGAI